MKRFAVALAVVLSASFAQAAQVFLSSSADDPNATGDVTLLPGQETQLFVFFRPEGGEVINGAAVDVATDAPGILDATASVVLNPTAGPFGPRFNGDPNNGNTDPSDPNLLVEGMLGVSVNATGIDGAINDFGDFDPTFRDGALRFADITVRATGAGVANVSAQANPANPITGEGLGAIDVTFGSITVITIPEPATVGLLGLAAVGLVGLRRRS